jgi:deoxyribonuclease V
MTIVAVDVDYRTDCVVTACIGFAAWGDATAEVEWVGAEHGAAAPYEPGQFYRRELPYLVRAVAAVKTVRAVDAVVVDAHAWLDEGRPGLGAHLATALGAGAVVVGIAKTRYRGGAGLPVLRGQSQTPLWVSAVGMGAAAAAELVRAMAGPFRLPALLARVDGLARGRLTADPSKRLA